METYLDRIKRLKSEQHLTNDLLAEKSGIPLGTLSKILAGMSDSPKLSTMISLCGALGCSVEYIVSGTPENNNNYLLSADEIRLMEAYRSLDRWGKSLVETVAEKEAERVQSDAVATAETETTATATARVLSPITPVNRYAGEPVVRTGKRQISLF